MSATKKIFPQKPFLLFVVVLLLAVSPNSLKAQQSKSHHEKQPWVTGKLPPATRDFRYVVAHGEGKSVKASRDDARLFLIIELGFSKGVKVESERNIELQSEDNYSGGFSSYNESTKQIDSYKIEGDGYSMSLAALDEYYEKSVDNYQIWVLYAVSDKEFTPVVPEYSHSYGFAAVWRSSLVPGWGQFYKKQTDKGLCFLAAEGVLVGTAVYSGMQYTDNVRKSNETTKLTLIKEYRNRADKWELRRNNAIGSAVSVYVWNVLNAALAKGKIKYAWIPENLEMTAYTDSKSSLRFYGLSYNF
nr:DUF5683 domain-containing protein [uncultured Draconibacterium sp.]